MNSYVYSIEDDAEHAKTLYVNLTNKCTNSCVFCIRRTVNDIKGKNMWLENEDFSSMDVIEQFEKFDKPEQVVFCGYGEPFMSLDVLKGVAAYLKQKNIYVRVNTNGIGNVVNHRDIVPEIKDLVDEVSVSLNSSNLEQYNQISQPKYSDAFYKLQLFVQECIAFGIKTTVTVVDGYPDYTLDIPACEKLAELLGADLRVRKWIKNGY